MMSPVPIMCSINRMIQLSTTYDVHDAEIGKSNKGISWLEFYLFLDTMESGSLNIAVELKSNKENVSVGDQLEFELEIDPEMANAFK